MTHSSEKAEKRREGRQRCIYYLQILIAAIPGAIKHQGNSAAASSDIDMSNATVTWPCELDNFCRALEI